MDSHAALAYALAKPGAWPDSPWGENHDLAKVGNKIFLFPGLGDHGGGAGVSTITVKNTTGAVEELKSRYPEAAGPAPYLNKQLWVRLVIDQVPDDEVRELIDDSYDLVVATLPKSQRPQPPG
ncbi:MAG: MmcQ/YjbR family DNA-binding protein [Actinomycetota bacterium]|nr:MmcQ/YjbR family DNA-binding protein [Actinomycetota bacterium]MDQ2957777.1 MmcQ/YjbR family DNA-binding protein [Actinomycetota bacterium]